MSHLITNGSVNSADLANAKDRSELEGGRRETPVQVQNPTQASQPNVRHIPIFVEGRDEPLFNKDTTTVDGPVSRPVPVLNDIPQTGSIFNRVKDIPVKKVPGFQASNIGRAASPARTIPINVVHTQANKTAADAGHPNKQSPKQQTPPRSQQQQEQEQQQPPHQIHPEHIDRRSQSPKAPPIDPITKIQNIQKEVLELMDQVEKFKGGSRKDKEYIYLDEMLTQNLLKLDTIDTDGKESVKAARKEAIHCINKCIQVLEAKTESAGKTKNSSDGDSSHGSKEEHGQGCTQQDNKRNIDSRSKSSNGSTGESAPQAAST